MKQNGRTTVNISDLVYGCWQMGGDYWGPVDIKAAEETVQYALIKGITTFDTAYCYGAGKSEELLGKALQDFRREDYQLSSKLWVTSLGGTEAVKACEDSLRRLQTEFLDIYFIHYPDPTGTVPISETMEALMYLKHSGKIKSIGVSNFSLAQLKEAQKYGDIDVIQPCYNLLWRFIDKDILPYCKEQNISVMAYSPLAQGLLSGKYGPGDCREDGRSHAALFQEPYYGKALKVTECLKEIAVEYETTPGNLALNWVMKKDGITAPITGIRKKKHVDDGLKALDIQISDEAMARIEEESRAYTATLPHFKSFFAEAVLEEDVK